MTIRKTLLSLFSAVIFGFFTASSASAVYVKSGDTLNLPKDKPLNETVVVSASALTIDSDINGDLYCAGKDIVVTGMVKGDIICIGQTIKIQGPVTGSVRLAGQSIVIDSKIDRNVTVASQSLDLGSKSEVKGDLFFGVQNVSLQGKMGRDLSGAGETITITGSLLRDAKITSDKLTLTKDAAITGNLDYYVSENGQASIADKTVKGSTTKHTTASKETQPKPKVTTPKYNLVGTFIGAVSFFILACALFILQKGYFHKTVDRIKSKPLISSLIGIAVLICAPIVLLIGLVSVILTPLSFVTIFAYLVFLITSSLYVSFYVGELFLGLVVKGRNTNPYQTLAVGCLLMALITSIPLLGFILGLVALSVGLGAQVYLLFNTK